MGFFSDFAEGFKMTPAEMRANLEKKNPGAGKRFDAWKKREDGFKAVAAKRMAASSTNGSILDPTNPVTTAHLMAASGALDPKVAFSLGAPGAPDGTGKLVGLNGLYKG